MIIKISDKFGRPFMEINGDRVAVGRIDGLSSKEAESLISIYQNLTGDLSKEIKDFVLFSTVEDEFCS